MKVDPHEFDHHKLMYHPERVAEWKEKGDCYPIYVEIGSTDVCNQKCIFCALDWVWGNNFIDKKVMLNTLKDMAKHGVKSVMFAGEGESLLHKDICLFIQKAKKYGMDVSMTTNGTLFNKEKREKILPSLSWIRFSVDAVKDKTYAKIHGTNEGNLKKIIHSIKESVRLKRKWNLKTIIGVQFLLIPQNSKEVLRFAKLFKKIGVDNVQIKPYSQHPNSINKFAIHYKKYPNIANKLKELNSKSFKVLFREETIKRMEKITYPYCFGIPFFALIDARGNIIPCNLFYDSEEFNYGNLNKNSFSQIWEGKQRKIVLKKLKEKGCDKCRKGCRLDAVNRYLHRIKSPEEHDNFL